MSSRIWVVWKGSSFRQIQSLFEVWKKNSSSSSSSCTNRWMKSRVMCWAKNASQFDTWQSRFLFTNNAFLSMRFLHLFEWPAHKTSNAVSFALFLSLSLCFKRFKTKTTYNICACALGASTHVSHLPYIHWLKRYRSDRCISEMCTAAAHYSIWFQMLAAVQTTVNMKSMCSGCVRSGRKCAQRVQILFMTVFFRVSNEFDTRACVLSPKRTEKKGKKSAFFKWTSHPDVLMNWTRFSACSSIMCLGLDWYVCKLHLCTFLCEI